MQTFLPFSDYEQVAETLDNKRLNKQILEGYQILKVLSGASESGAWRNHPAVLMWKNSEHYLDEYVNYMVIEAAYRGIKTDKNVSNLKDLKASFKKRWGNAKPIWSNPEHIDRVLTTHKANLYRKDAEAYAQFYTAKVSEFNKPCCDKCLYYWATHIKDKEKK